MHNVVRRAVVVAVVLGAGAGVAAAAPGVAAAAPGPALAWSPPSPFSFGTLAPGGSLAQKFTLKNTGGAATSALTLTVTPGAGTPASAFIMSRNTCTGTSLGPGKSCTVTITYTAPTTPGQASGATLTATSKKLAAPASVTLSGAAAKVTPGITTTQQPATGPAGTTIADQATVAGPPGDTPTGTVTFYLYENSNCNDPVLTDPEPLTNGVATGGGIVATGPGTVYWVASYGGDASNNPVTTGCSDEPVTITQAQPAITTTQQPAVVLPGTQIADQATVTGGFLPSGTVTFTLYGNSDCTGTLFTDTEQLPPNGTSVTSASYTATTTGTDYWVATYNGDLANLTATSSCGGEPVTISACLVTDTTSGQAFPDLPDAVAAATSGDTLDIQGTCTGTTEIGTSLTLTGQPTGKTPATLDGNQQGTVLTIDFGVTVTLNTLTITGGNGLPGGGILNVGTVTVNNSTITGNTTSRSMAGAGIFNDRGTVTLDNTTVTSNTAPGDSLGGGIFSNGTVTLSGTSTVTSNSAGLHGGGIYVACGSTLNGATAGTGGNVYNNTPDDIFTQTINC